MLQWIVTPTKLDSVSFELVDEMRFFSFFFFVSHISPSRRMYVSTGNDCGWVRLLGCFCVKSMWKLVVSKTNSTCQIIEFTESMHSLKSCPSFWFNNSSTILCKHTDINIACSLVIDIHFNVFFAIKYSNDSSMHGHNFLLLLLLLPLPSGDRSLSSSFWK